MNAIKEIGDQIVSSIKSYIDNKIEIISLKLDIFEQRVKNVQDGRNGLDGRDGRDALDLNVMSEIDTNVSYAKGTFSQHKNGLFYATKQTNGMDGWKCLVSGIDEISVEISDDMRKVSLKTVKSTGELFEKSFNVPSLIYKGVFDQKEKYSKGDCVTFSGSMWVSKSEDNESKPGDSDDWQLSVKRGAK